MLQQQLFERTYEYILRDAALFSSTQYLTELGQDLCDRPLASEKDLEAYQPQYEDEHPVGPCRRAALAGMEEGG